MAIGAFEAWRPIAGLGDAAAARMIHGDGLHVLLDLSGHTAYHRLPLFALRPAPVAASWLGYFASTGVDQIDYLVGDPHCLPPEAQAMHTERIWNLPETRLCFTPPREAPPVGPLPALSADGPCFCCFNNLSKVNETVVDAWSAILRGVPRSRLFLKARQLDEPAVRERVTQGFAARGIGADRLHLEGHSARAQYLAAYQRADIALDPFPYTGGTTTAEALWMGVPVLTLAGDCMVARQGVGLLRNAGLPQWIASDLDDYVQRAVALAGDVPALASLRAALRPQLLASPVFDATRFARHLEDALFGMWNAWENAGDRPPAARALK